MIERKNEVKQGVIVAFLSAAALTGSLYVGKAQDYREAFIPGTVINGINASERTVGEMEEILGDYQIEIAFRDGEPLEIAGDDIDYHYVSDGSLERLMKEQSPYLWGYGLYKGSEFTIPEKKVYSEEKLRSIVTAAPQMQTKNMVSPKDAFIDYQDGKWLVVPEVEGTTLDPKSALNAVVEGISKEQEKIDLDQTEGIYSAPEKRKDEYWLNSDTKQLNELAGARIEYKLPDGGTKVLDGPILEDWLSADDDGYYYIDEPSWNDHIDEFVKELADEVDTVYKEHPFTTHEGDEIMLPGKGYYGYRIDKKNEAEQLREEIADNEQLEREPVYWRTEASDPDDNHGFGGDYVEVDLSLQHLWIYENYEVIFETDVVSGLNDKEHRTPAGAFFAYDKKRDTTLRGDKQDDGEWGYETDVSYWIRLTDTGIGLHDASWRYSFGGNIWRWNGSHGCINIPTWAMPTIYEIVDVNMPVAVHYGDTQ